MHTQYRNLWKIYSLSSTKLVLLEHLLGALIWMRRHVTMYHWIGNAAKGLQFYFPERRKIIIYFLGYRLILWLSLQSQTE